LPGREVPEMSLRVRAVIVDDQGRVLLDRTAHVDRPPFYWLPGGGVDPGETTAEALERELVEEASLRIVVGRLLYLSENLFVESGDYRHETILYRLATIVGKDKAAPVDPRAHEWHRLDELPAPLHPLDVARELAFDIGDGFRRPPLHLITDERPR
jgi:8-oxo-dGTP pyrophosphatase MutT (NUDIX family)